MREDQEHTKDVVRRAMRAARDRLSPADVERCSANACRRVVALPAFAQASRVVAYRPRDNEVDPGVAVAAAVAAGKPVYLPAADGVFRRSDPGGEQLPAGLAGVLFLIPGLAFDARGVRLGRGGGWYDRALRA